MKCFLFFPDVSSSRRIKGKDDQDVRWSSPVKHPPLSLTERLRREFGVDASESEEEDDKGKFGFAPVFVLLDNVF